MKKHFALYFLLALSACKNDVTEEKQYEAHKNSIAETEQEDLLQFIIVKGESKKHLLGRTVVRGTLENKATVCSYKNIRVQQIAFAGDKRVEEHEDVIETTIEPGAVVSFKTRYKLPKGTDSVALFIMKADLAECKTE